MWVYVVSAQYGGAMRQVSTIGSPSLSWPTLAVLSTHAAGARGWAETSTGSHGWGSTKE